MRKYSLVQKGFTLAEVLITLAIIGIVAALTIPTLVSKYQERAIVTALKKNISVLSQAYKMALNDNNWNSNFGYLDAEYVPLPEEEGPGVYDKNGNYNSDVFYNALKKYLKVIKDCGREGQTGCFPDYVVSALDSSESWNLVTMQGNARRCVVLSDGSSLAIDKSMIYIDVNGLKGPNKVGYDVFQVKVGKNSIEHYDDMKDSLDCYTNIFTCAAWVVANGNLDYLHCDDLSWDGKHSCK